MSDPAPGSGRHARAAALTLPALLAGLGLQLAPSLEAVLFTGGWRVVLMSACLLLLTPYVALLPLAIARLTLRGPPDSSPLSSLERVLLEFFAGAALMTLGGVALGLVGLLRPWLTLPVCVALLYLFFLRTPGVPGAVLGWLRGDEVSAGSGAVRWLTSRLRLLSLGVVALLLVARGLLPDVWSADVPQLYFPFMREIRHQHGLWLEPAVLPIYSDWLIGRGNGALLFWTSFTVSWATQIVSVVYALGLGLIVERFVFRIVPAGWEAARSVLPAAGLLLALSGELLGVELGKYHLQTGAFLTSLGWGALLLAFTDGASTRWLRDRLLLVAVAIPLLLPQYQGAATLTLCLAAPFVAAAAGLARTRSLLLLLAAGCGVTLLSLTINFLYLGVAATNPELFFVHLADAERLARWTSVDSIRFQGLLQDHAALDPGHLVRRGLSAATSPTGAAVLACLVAAVAGAVRWRGRDDRPLDRATVAFAAGFPALFGVGTSLIMVLNQRSLRRLFRFQDVFAAGALFALVVLLWAHVRRTDRARRPLLVPGAVAGIACVLAGAGVVRHGRAHVAEVGGLRSVAHYLLGREGLAAGVQWNPWDYGPLRELARVSPGPERVLPLNGYKAATPLKFSPLLPRGKVIHHYESILAPHFREVMLGEPDRVYARCRALGIDLFYVQKEDVGFCGPGLTDAFSGSRLRAGFDVAYEGEAFWLLTWRGEGLRPVPAGLAARIDAWREQGRAAPPSSAHWKAFERYRDGAGR